MQTRLVFAEMVTFMMNFPNGTHACWMMLYPFIIIVFHRCNIATIIALPLVANIAVEISSIVQPYYPYMGKFWYFYS